MPTESATYIDDLTPSTPAASAAINEADDEIRQLKSVLQNTFPNVSGAVTATHTELNALDGVTASAAELNILDGVTSTAAELNLVDGSSAGAIANSKAVIYGSSGEVNATTLQIGGTPLTASAAEFNYVTGVTSAIQTQINSKLTSPSSDTSWTSINNTPTNATAGSGYYITDNNDVVLTLPGSPTAGQVVFAAQASAGKITFGRNSLKIMGKTADYEIGGSPGNALAVYTGDANVGWIILSN